MLPSFLPRRRQGMKLHDEFYSPEGNNARQGGYRGTSGNFSNLICSAHF